MTLTFTRNKVILVLFAIVGLISIFLSRFTGNSLKEIASFDTTDIDQIKKRGKIIALTENTSTSYYLYKGEQMGYEYELLKAFAKEIRVELEIKIAKDLDSVFDRLNSGEVDIVAANLTVTNERLSFVNFTSPLLHTRQVLIQRKPEGWEKMSHEQMNRQLIRNSVDLVGENIHIRKGSSFYSRLLNLSEEIGGNINIVEAPGDFDTELLINKVANGEIDYTVADENVALINQTYYANIDIETPISFPQKIAWAVRKNTPSLNKALNQWIEKNRNSKEMASVYDKYFKRRKINGSGYEAKYVPFSSTNSISVYDDMIREYSKKIGWDWQLLAALIYQESHFSPTARSWAGANGLMQLVPATAKRYGLDTVDATAEQSIKAGTGYISDLDKYWKSQIPDKKERIKFILASYNVGLGHVMDARKLAGKYGRDPDVWSENVEYMILQKSNPKVYNDSVVKFGYCRGRETANYVKEILKRYEHYKTIRFNDISIAKN